MNEFVSVRNLCAGYGKLQVLRGVNLAIMAQQIVGLIGHNGAGKTTLLRVVAGLHPSRGGDVVYSSSAGVVRSSPLTSGVAYVPQGRGAFPNLTVHENIEVGLWTGAHIRLTSSEGKRRVDRVVGQIPLIAELWNRSANQLSGGQRSLVSIGRALVLAPRFLLLDEPSTGLAPVMAKQVMAVIDRIRAEDEMAVLVVEQNIPELMTAADYVYVLNRGRIARSGAPSEFDDYEALLLEF